MENIHSARIIYKIEESVQAVYLKEFLMFYGVYVREYVVEDNNNLMSDFQMVDLNIMFSNISFENKKLLSKHNITIFSNEHYNGSLATLDARKQFGQKIKKVFLNNPTILNLFGDQKEFEQIWDVFIDQDYAYRDYWCHSLVTEMSKEKIDELIQIYVNCMNSLNVEPKLEGGIYLQYAYLNCARKYERLLKLNHYQNYFNSEKLMARSTSLKDRDSMFSIGDALAGIIGLGSINHIWEKGESCIKSAFEAEQNNEHIAFLYYILGDFYEWNRKDLETASSFYNRMNIIVPNNYRALYKVACEKYKNGKKKEAYDIFFKIYDSMYMKEQCGWIKPQEIEYYYKCAEITSHMKNSSNGCYGRRNFHSEQGIQDIRYKLFSNSKFVNNFLEEEQIGNYQSMLAEKMVHYTRSRSRL